MAKETLLLDGRLMNVAGTLGFAPDRRSPVDLERLSAFITNPVSLAPRTPVNGPRLLPFPGGFLLHTGFPNPGLRTVIRRYSGRWALMRLPLIVHLLARSPEEVYQLVLELEWVEGVSGVELGLPPGISPEQAVAFLKAARGERPLIVQLPFEQAQELAGVALENGFSLVSLAPPRGMFAAPDGNLISGRLYGPAMLPVVLPVVQALAEQGLEVIASGGIYSSADLRAMQRAGARYFQLDGVLWRGEIPQLTS
jgi:dihydroorotate dehydrogenase (NAD+) catalytic subunit